MCGDGGTGHWFLDSLNFHSSSISHICGCFFVSCSPQHVCRSLLRQHDAVTVLDTYPFLSVWLNIRIKFFKNFSVSFFSVDSAKKKHPCRNS